MTGRRQRQVAELLHEELSELIQQRAHDPRLGFVTVTGVDVTPDLRNARVFVSILGDEEEARLTLEGLQHAAGFFRRELASALSLRYTPALTFRRDTSFEVGRRIDELLEQIGPSGPEDDAEEA